MSNKEKSTSVSGTMILLLVFLNALIIKIAFIQNEKWYIALVITLPLLLVAVLFNRQKKHAALTNSSITDKVIDENTISIEQTYEQGSNKVFPQNLQFLN